jgi:RNA polymerase sigma-70 factor (ECF subfamily)
MDGEGIRDTVDSLYRAESRRVLATLIRLLGDFDLAEEALHDAFAAALDRWPRHGLPANPRAWLVSAGRFQAIDRIRRRARFDAVSAELADRIESEPADETDPDPRSLEDDRLRLVFTCCHPALQADAQVALTLREVCGLTTEEIAAAFLVSPTTVAQRIVRAKAKIRQTRIPYRVPSLSELADRLDNVLHVVYLVFNEGYLSARGDALARSDLSSEAIRLGRLLADLLPEPEVFGLLALMLFHESRRHARATLEGDLILLDEQDRSLWDGAQIRQGRELVDLAFASGRIGSYTLQAAIAALHAQAPTLQATNWAEIAGIYEILRRADPSPVVELNRAVAIAMRDGPAAGLELVDALLGEGNLADYHLAHSARADFCRKLAKWEDARISYLRALELVRSLPQRRFLEKRLRELAENGTGEAPT